MSSADNTRERVLAAVAADLRPVRPVLSPPMRALAVVPIAAVVTVLAYIRYEGANFAEIGAAIAWGLSAVQWVVGLVILIVAFREAMPGSSLPQRVLWWGAVGTVALVLTTTWVTHAAHPTFIPPGRTWRVSYLCFTGPLKLGAPLLLLTAFLAGRAFPTTPARVGALCGLAAGIMVDSGWRLTCWITAPSHVLSAHTLAVFALVGLGAAIGFVFDWLGRLRR